MTEPAPLLLHQSFLPVGHDDDGRVRVSFSEENFFPFPDGVEEIAKHGVTAVVQPGGSKRIRKSLTPPTGWVWRRCLPECGTSGISRRLPGVAEFRDLIRHFNSRDVPVKQFPIVRNLHPDMRGSGKDVFHISVDARELPLHVKGCYGALFARTHLDVFWL